MFRWNFLCSNLCLLSLVLSLSPTEKNLAPFSWLHPLDIDEHWDDPLNLPFSRLNNPHNLAAFLSFQSKFLSTTLKNILSFLARQQFSVEMIPLWLSGLLRLLWFSASSLVFLEHHQGMTVINVVSGSFVTLTPLKVSSHEQLIAFSRESNTSCHETDSLSHDFSDCTESRTNRKRKPATK